MLCPKCNTQNRENAKFCKVCGYAFPTQDATASEASASQPVNVQSTDDAQNISPSSAASINEVAAAPTATINEVATAPTASINEGVATSTASDNGATSAQAENSSTSAASSNGDANTSEPQIVEVVVPPASDVTTSDSTDSTNSTDITGTTDTANQDTARPEDDISLSPTQVLSPRERSAYQARRWQYEANQADQIDQATGEDESPATSAGSSQIENESVPHPEADAQAMPASTLPPPVARADDSDTPNDLPTSEGNEPDGASAQIAPPPPSDDRFDQMNSNPHVSAYAEQAAALPASVLPPTSEANSSQEASLAPITTTEPSSASPENTERTESETSMGTYDSGAQANGATPAQANATDELAVGTLVAGRYEVIQSVHADDVEHVYQVVDHQGYQHCWNCGSEQNAEGEEFCIDCGAQLLDAHYLMHEYGANVPQDHDASVLHGTIANTFVDNGKTYVIEQQHAAQLAFPNGVHLLSASDSDAGNVRRSEPNEDSTLVLQLQRVHESQATPVGIYIIADGMGGHDNGQGASRMAINVIADKMIHELLLPPLDKEKSEGLNASVTPPEEDALVGMFKGAIEEANNVLVQTNQHDKTDMGSTLTGFMIVDDSAFIINVGDSRTYILRDNTLYQLTNDHSLVAQLVAGGLIEPDDVYTHPQRSQIFRSLGDKMNVQVDDFKQQLLPGDILLSCSDGLWEMVRNPQITEILSGASDPQAACAQLIEAANTNGGEDNVSAVVVFVR